MDGRRVEASRVACSAQLHAGRRLARVDQEDRIALFLDYENLALGARDHLGGMAFDFRPIADALAERGRVVVRRAYADWSYFDEDRRMLTRHHVELIEIPQRMGASRKNAADIKMAVDAMELAFERDVHHDVRALHRRQRLHPAGAQAARAQQAGHRHRRREVDLGAAAARRATSSSSTTGSRASTSRRARTGAAARPGRAEPGAGSRAGAGSPSRSRRPRSRHATSTRSPCWSPRPSPACRAAPSGDGDRVHAQAHPAAQGPDLQRVRLRVPHLRRAAAPPRRAQRGRAGRGPGQGRPRGRPCPSTATGRRRSRCCARVVPDLAGSDGAVALSGLKNQLRRVAARLQREEARLPQLPAVLQGGRHQRRGRPAVEPGRRRLPAHHPGMKTADRSLPVRAQAPRARVTRRTGTAIGTGNRDRQASPEKVGLSDEAHMG